MKRLDPIPDTSACTSYCGYAFAVDTLLNTVNGNAPIWGCPAVSPAQDRRIRGSVQMKKPILFLLFFLVFAGRSHAQCTGGASPNWTWTLSANFASGTNNLQGCINKTSNGDTITISSGSVTPNGGVSWKGKGITIIGAGTPNSTSGTTGPSSSCASNITLTIAGTFNVFTIRASYGNATNRVSCMVLSYSSGGAQGFNVLGTCTASGCPNLRIDNITFSNWAGHANNGISYGINAIGDMFGVIDHNTVTGNGVSGGYLQFAEIDHASYQGIGEYGDNSWAQPEAYGSSNFLFFEDNTFNYSGCCETEGNPGGFSSQGGARVVVRHNTFNISDQYNTTLMWHGTESNGRPRGGRAFEYYENTVNYPSTCVPSGNCAPTVSVRSGTGLVWGNTINSATSNIGGFLFNTLRVFGDPGGWGACDGTSAPDNNDPHGAYWSGTIGSVSSTSQIHTITVSGTSPGWSTNYWTAGSGPNPQPGGAYSVHDITQTASIGVAVGSEITASGANTLTTNIGGPGAYVPASGDSIQITRAFSCLDQGGGRSASTAYNASTLYSTYPNPASFSKSAPPSGEISSPAYVVMNSYTNQVISGSQAGADTGRVIRNRDFYVENTNQGAQTSPTSPFDGTTTIGMGHGTLANRPTTCTTGVGYWATDQGSWNTSGSGGQGELYVCTATNTWSPYYTPNTYPHPLVSGHPPPPPPAAPTNVTVTVQ